MLCALPDADLAAALRGCCGMEQWVDRVMARRPFTDDAAVLAAADAAFAGLDLQQWRQGFAAAGDPAVPADGEPGTRAAAELALQLYGERFGHPFVSAARPMDADELLMRIRIRLGNDARAELRTAAAELRRLARTRLERLLQGGAHPA
jgi:2-oxo-4-hydroxy-4-carboxy-5-ureidoimidazoline decarboxylase